MSVKHEVYPLSRDVEESERLNLQHRIYKSSLGYLLHPSIHTHSHMRIADVATGTGVWLLDLAGQLPSTCAFTGFDISNLQFPPSSQLPPNISFHQHDLLKPFPAEFVGSFDVVNIRLIFLVLRRGEWPLALRNVLTLLKAGGYLQWTEMDSATMHAVALNDGARTEHLTRGLALIEEIRVARSKDLEADTGGVELLLGLCKEEGLGDCIQDVVTNDRAPGLADANSRNSMAVFARMLAVSGTENAKEIVDGCRAETEGGNAMVRFNIHFVVGRKPGGSIEER